MHCTAAIDHTNAHNDTIIQKVSQKNTRALLTIYLRSDMKKPDFLKGNLDLMPANFF